MTSRPPAPDSDDAPSLRERKRRSTYRAILEAAAEIELVHGGALDPAVVTYARLAEIAGVSERTVYRFFPSKAELDEAYVKEDPITLDIELPDEIDLERYADLIEEIGIRWGVRTGGMRVSEHERDADDYPATMADRRARDEMMVEQVMAHTKGDERYDDRQRRAIAAAVHSTVSIRTLAITAQRWNLSIEEAARAHAWSMRTLLAALAADPPTAWGEDDG